MAMAVDQLQVLRRELDVDDAAGAGLEVARLAVTTGELALDALAQWQDRPSGRELPSLLARPATAGDGARLDRRLSLPQPGVLGVIAPPAGERGHQQTLRA